MGGRCLAGIDIETGNWIRPLGPGSTGEFPGAQTVIDGNAIRPGDVIEIDLARPSPSAHHPEDVELLTPRISLLEPRPIYEFRDLLRVVLDQPNRLLTDTQDRISQTEIDSRGTTNSLALVHAHDVDFGDGQSRRVVFEVGRRLWDLANTDDWGHWSGVISEGLMCISLGENFRGLHYKLACGFIPVLSDASPKRAGTGRRRLTFSCCRQGAIRAGHSGCYRRISVGRGMVLSV